MMQNPTSEVFNRVQVRRRRERASAGYHQADFLKKRVLEDISDRLASTGRTFERALCLGGYSTQTKEILGPFCGDLIETDFAQGRVGEGGVVADEEWLPFKDESFDLVVSPLALHWVNDLPGSLIQINRAMKPDGFFVGVLAGGASFTELRQSLLRAASELTGGAEMRVSPFADAADMSALLQRAGLALPVSDRDRLTIRYDTIFDVMRDLQALGETHAPAQGLGRPLRRDVLMRAAQIYASEFADADGRLRVTVDLIWVTGWAPHASQPKPKRPGSAKVSMAEAVGAKELPAGDKAGR